MYGAIYGDMVGSVYEYNQIKGITSIDPEELLIEDSFYTDDTILTVAICDAILHDRDYDYYLRKYINDVLNNSEKNKPKKGGFSSPFSYGLLEWNKKNELGTSIGNGAMMRISPVGYLFNTEDDVIKNAELATIPSHNSFEAIFSAKTIALIIYYLRMGYSKEEVFQKMNLPIKYEPFKSFNSTCHKTIGNCLWAFYQSNSFEDAIRKTLLMGGDTDTNSAIVGSMAEALYGIDDFIVESIQKKLPEDYVKVLDKAKEYGYRR